MTAKTPRASAAAGRTATAAAPSRPQRASSPALAAVTIRPVRRSDLEQVIEIDAQVTGLDKRDYYRSLYKRYGETGAERRFLVAESGGELVGFIIGEVRDWEFGTPPCGWVFALNVRPDARLGGTGTRLLDAICAGFRRAGVTKVRTLLSRENTLILSFFRSQGMMAAPVVTLETDLEP